MSLIDVWKKFHTKIRKLFSRYGYTCDSCGAEIFTYPKERLCGHCEEKLTRTGERFCGKCGRKTRAEGICLNCKRRLPKFTRGCAPFVYHGEVASLINRLKNGKPRLALYLGERMAEEFVRTCAEKLRADENGPLLVIPVPLSRERLRERGYNQSQRLAESVLENLKEHGFAAEDGEGILEKRKETRMQKHVSAKSRAENVAGAYHVRERKRCKDRIILLIDDIMTTGATGNECAARLFGAGAKEVYLLVAAALPEKK